ncbi:hypothetical protein Ocin01_18493 [Orchesella cincta]|uniref:Uncharacterized protein n=1 Tax=Orchesella cincta TaxID=48709 RepID=A0A1D2M5C6_ORCCI|nr:hypothetical protein Ocin01_18493 [Orchesella cincta]
MFLIPLGQKLCVGQKNCTKSRIAPPIHNEELLIAFKKSGGKLGGYYSSLLLSLQFDAKTFGKCFCITSSVFFSWDFLGCATLSELDN